MIQNRVGRGKIVGLTKACGVLSVSWVIDDGVILLLSREEFAVDTFCYAGR